MTIEDLIKEYNNFSLTNFISKVDNTFIMLLNSIVMDNLPKVSHKITKEMYQYYENMLKELNSKNIRQMYGELNIKETHIKNIYKKENKYVIEVLLISRYLEYQVEKGTNKFISGNNRERITKNNYLTFEKKINAKEELLVKKCHYCGANIDFNRNGVCDYCGKTYNTEKHDWVLSNIVIN